MGTINFILTILFILSVIIILFYIIGKFILKKITSFLSRILKKIKQHKHKWGSWQDVNCCTKKRTCKRCDKTQISYNHSWMEWEKEKDKDKLCSYVRECSKCSEKEFKVEHEWGDWYYLEDKKCLAERECRRCHTKTRKIRHQYEYGTSEYWGWDDWNNDFKDTVEYKKCKRCGDYIIINSHRTAYIHRRD